MPHTPMNRHQWSEPKVTIAQESPDGCERHERVCLVCGTIKTTIGQPDGQWRVEYWIKGGPVWATRPDCIAQQKAKLREAS